MNAETCIKSRRSIRRYQSSPIDHSLMDSIISTASFAPSWKNTQTPRYHLIEDPDLLKEIADRYAVTDGNASIIGQIPMLVALSYKKGICGYNQDGSYTTMKGDRWQMFDAGIACQTFCLAAEDKGLGTCIMGLFDEEGITKLLQIPEDEELAVLIAVGYPDQEPDTPKRESLDVIRQYR